MMLAHALMHTLAPLSRLGSILTSTSTFHLRGFHFLCTSLQRAVAKHPPLRQLHVE